MQQEEDLSNMLRRLVTKGQDGDLLKVAKPSRILDLNKTPWQVLASRQFDLNKVPWQVKQVAFLLHD